MNISEIINLAQYPLDNIDSFAYTALVNSCKQQLAEDGCCLLPGFIKSGALENAKQEAVTLAKNGYQMRHYFAYDDINDDTLNRNLDDLPENHPLRFKSLTKIRFIARDLIDLQNPIQKIHVWPNMCTFLQRVMDLPTVYTNDCPLSSCVFTVAEEGELQDWHFDGTEFIVTLMLEDSEEGGNFEFVRNLRKPGIEDDFENIAKVLNNQHPDINRPNIQPGALTLFKGKYSFHRASPVKGDGRRIMAVLSYETVPGKTGSDEYLKLFYGRTLAEAIR